MTQNEPGPPPAIFGLLLSDDLMFSSRISGAARPLGITLRTARNQQALESLAGQQVPRCVIVDLANPGLDIRALVAQLRQSCPTMPRVVAYGSHVDTAGLQEGRDAGCDPVLPRSRFSQELEQSLPVWFSL